MPAPGMMSAKTAEILRLHAAGLGCVEIGRRVGVSPKTVCTSVKWWKTRKCRGQYDDDKGSRMTEQEIEAMVAEQMECLPSWWVHHEKVQRQADGPRLGRAAVPVNTRLAGFAR